MGFLERGSFRKVHFLEILENVDILEFLENSQTVENKGDSGPSSRDAREIGDFRDSRDFSSEKTPIVMTPLLFRGVESCLRPFEDSRVAQQLSGPRARDTAILSLRYAYIVRSF